MSLLATYTDDGELLTGGYREKCHKCSGSGRFVGYSGKSFGQCFACKGAGYREFKSSTEVRAKARDQRHDRNERERAENIEFFRTQYPAEYQWLAGNLDFEFAASLHEQVIRRGELSDNQLAAIRRNIEARDAKRAAREAAAAPIAADGIDALSAAFNRAKAAGLKFPKLRFDGFVASVAPANSRNAGAVYLKTPAKRRTLDPFAASLVGQEETEAVYLGKISGGRFHASRECDDATKARIVATMADPTMAAVAYGKRFGSCACCGRELSDPESVARGVGPICAENFGF